MTDQLEGALERLPIWVRDAAEWVLSMWVGRILVRTVAATMRVEVFDRAMTIAAQFFTSILPLLIVVVTFIGAADSQTVAEVIGAPESSTEVIEAAVQGSSPSAFGAVGILLVVVSATSLSRALTRTFAVIWQVARPSWGVRAAWRWLAVVMVLFLSVVIAQELIGRASLLPPQALRTAVLSFVSDFAVATFVPWILLTGFVRARWLLPGAAAFAAVMSLIRPAAEVWLPWALEVSSQRYGPIGMAFTYLAWLYVVAFVFVATAVLGQVLVSDEGTIGQRLRGEEPAELGDAQGSQSRNNHFNRKSNL
ncbi:MAG TPA: YhjD/YihY/BrkB family envelope integrity protein [Aeromicrobium sp.]|nr:YhjD/YihY/BrkB family envelope integrity protein [Aeromicrobium sp.]